MLRLALVLLLTALASSQTLEVTLQLRSTRKDEMLSLLSTLVPGLQCSFHGDLVTLVGTQDSINQAKELVEILDGPPDGVSFFLKAFTLESSEIKNLGIFWRTPRIGVAYRPCFGSSDMCADRFISRGQGTVLTSPSLTGSLDKECGLTLLESKDDAGPVGLRLKFLARRLSPNKMNLALTLVEQWPSWQRKLTTEVPVSDGNSLVIRGLAEDHAGQNVAGLNQLPVWGPLFRAAENDRELLLMITPGMQ